MSETMMTLQQLQQIHPTATAKTWHQHPNGGGWVENTAHVDETPYVGPNATVSGRATVFGHAKVSGYARVSGHAMVYGNAEVSGHARVYGYARVSGYAKAYGHAEVSDDAEVSKDALVYGYAKVYGHARISGYARVSGHAEVSGDARVSGDSWQMSPLYIQGSRYSLTACKSGWIAIGCQCHSIAWWLKHGEALATREGFSAEEIAEYRLYVELFAARYGVAETEDVEVEAQS